MNDFPLLNKIYMIRLDYKVRIFSDVVNLNLILFNANHLHLISFFLTMLVDYSEFLKLQLLN